MEQAAATTVKDRWRVLFPAWPWLLCAVAVTMSATALALSLLNRLLVNPWENLFGLAAVLAYGTPGALIVVRQRSNRIGWLFLVVALLLALQGFADQYAVYSFLVARRPLPGAIFAAWLLSWVATPAFLLIALFLLLYPDGRLLSRRWWPVVLMLLLSWSGVVLRAAVHDEPLMFYPLMRDAPLKLLSRNPLAMPALATVLPNYLWAVGIMLFMVAALAPLLRYRGANAATRLQLRWLVFLATLLFVGVSLQVAGEILSARLLPPDLDPLAILFLGFPLAVSLAILRYHLYEIDLIVRRTLIYGLLTGSLALVYLASIVLLQSWLPARSQLATVISTLAVAALFSPLRRRIQSSIDRRFYRRKYDAEATLAAFGATVRNEVDLESLVDTLVDTVEETVQPAHMSIWLVAESQQTRHSGLTVRGV